MLNTSLQSNGVGLAMSVEAETKWYGTFFKVIHSVANPQPTPSYSGRNWVRLQVSKTGELPVLRARNNAVDFLVRCSSKISEPWALTCHFVDLHLEQVNPERRHIGKSHRSWGLDWSITGKGFNILSYWSVWLGRRRLIPVALTCDWWSSHSAKLQLKHVVCHPAPSFNAFDQKRQYHPLSQILSN